ncbi:MAG: carboxypeptidase-like regulatory domain-containing protein [Bacteroidota bacterium]
MNRLLLCTLTILLFCSTLSIAQTGIVRGNVYDKDSGEPIIYGTVRIDGTTIGTSTDINGFFNIPAVPVGSYKLVATYIGYDSVAVEVTVKENTIIYRRMNMQEGGINLDVVQVSAEKAKARTEVKVSSVTLTPKQIRALPSTGGEADIAQYLPVIPGVIFTGDQGGQLYIRGGSPIQNKILLDGMTIYNPFHSIGFFSVFETEAIRSVDVLTGGFNAEYGGRISAVVDIKTREGNKKRFGGLVSTNPFQSKVLFEGPLKKLKDDDKGAVSFLVTGKRSYIDETSTVLYDYAGQDSLGLPYNFTDLYGKMSFVGGNGSKLDLFGFNFQDNVNFLGLAKLDWTTSGGGARFTLVPNNSNMIIGGSASYSLYEISLDEEDGNPRSSSIGGFTTGLDFTFFGKNDNEFKYGLEVNTFTTDFSFRNFLQNNVEQENNTTELSAFFKYKHKFGGLIIEPSFRFQYYASLRDLSLEPRFGLKYNATDFLRFKLAGGLYSQNLISSVNERDIVNLFVGFLSGPDQTIFKPNSTEPTDHRLQKSTHAIFGIEYDVTDRLEINVEPYYKNFNQLINLNRNKISGSDPDFATETGEAYGIDFLVKYATQKLYVWATYSLGYVNRDDGQQVYRTIFDRRHNVNFLITYSMGEANEWEASARWNMGSGFPFTLTQGFYELFNFQDGLSTDVLTGNGDLGIIYDEERNAGILPYYHRLDVSLKRRFTFSKNSKLEAVVSVTNVYNRNNIFFFDRVEYDRVNQLPILPSFGLIFQF